MRPRAVDFRSDTHISVHNNIIIVCTRHSLVYMYMYCNTAAMYMTVPVKVVDIIMIIMVCRLSRLFSKTSEIQYEFQLRSRSFSVARGQGWTRDSVGQIVKIYICVDEIYARRTRITLFSHEVSRYDFRYRKKPERW